MSAMRGAGVMAVLSAALAAQGSPGFAAAWAGATKRFEQRLAAEGVVGASLYFTHEGQVRGAHHFGHADRGLGRAVDADTIYHWASITKTLTAVGLMQLVDRGLVSLDAPIVDFLPEVKAVHNPFGPMKAITLRHLLGHASGFRGPTFPWGGQKPWHPHEPTRWSQVAAMMPYTEIHFAPGSKYGYSNPGFSMLGRVIEIVSGDDIEVYLHKNVLMPLGMTRSYFDATPWHLARHRSNNYRAKDGKLVTHGPDFDTGATTGNGGLNGPVGDLLRWADFLLGIERGEAAAGVLSRKTLEGLWRPAHPTGNPHLRESMGLGFFVIDAETGFGVGRRYVGHTGSQKGFRSFFYLHPESRTAVVFAANTSLVGMSRSASVLGRTRRDAFHHLFPCFGRQ